MNLYSKKLHIFFFLKGYIWLIVLLLFPSLLSAQNININVVGLTNPSAKIYSLQGEKIILIDSVSSSQNGFFQFSIDNKKYHTGFYRISFSSNRWIDFINGGEDVVITTSINNILDSLKIITSVSNQIYYAFLKINKSYKTKSELLQFILARYPKDDDYYKTTTNKLVQLQSEYLEFIEKVKLEKPKSFIARYVESSQLSVIDGSLSPEQQLIYLKTHSLDNVDFKNAELIYSDAFTNKSIEYLTLYRNPQLPLGLLEKEFQSAVDTILNKAKVNQIVYRHIVEYLIDGFKKFGFNEVVDYIVQNYVIKDDLCLDEQTEKSIEKRIEQSKRLAIGSIAPNIIIPDSNGEEIYLSKITAEKILIIFYASWCPHCQTMLPEIRDLYNQQKEKKFEVLAISLDQKKSDWLNFIISQNLNWINSSDLKGWEGKAAMDYYIYATPTMFLIDKQKKIISKPLSPQEVMDDIIF